VQTQRLRAGHEGSGAQVHLCALRLQIAAGQVLQAQQGGHGIALGGTDRPGAVHGVEL
jgi:hypothetical protein